MIRKAPLFLVMIFGSSHLPGTIIRVAFLPVRMFSSRRTLLNGARFGKRRRSSFAVAVYTGTHVPGSTAVPGNALVGCAWMHACSTTTIDERRQCMHAWRTNCTCQLISIIKCFAETNSYNTYI
jgi:hypothetical protein